MESFRRRVAVITGASSGIGRALAHQMAEEGAWLSLAARDEARLEEVARECGRRGGRAVAVPTDVADEAQCKALIARAVAEYGQLDVLINNAGFAMAARFADLPDLRLFGRVMDVNFRGPVQCTYYALPHLRRTRGRIVNVSSLGGRVAIPYNSSYVASKHALEGFSESLRMEVGNEVSVTVICPFWVATEFHERFVNERGEPRGAGGRAIYTEKTMTPEQCARRILSAARQRKREVVMRPGRPAQWLKLLAPSWLDAYVVRAFMPTIIERMSSGRTPSAG
jgi:short-subunit dehydrogenase